MKKRTEMRLLNINDRISSFSEVALGYNKEEAILESSRCLNCKNPSCVKGCPVNVNIPKFIEFIKNDDCDSAYNEIVKDNLLPGICGRVCPQEKQCEGNCILGKKGDPIAIGRLERYASDNANKNIVITKKNNYNVAIVGSGPSGLACAGSLLDYGFNVTIFEALHIPGGVLTYGIPEFRLPKRIVNEEINNLVNKGCIIKTNYVIGKTKTLEELQEEFDAIFIGTGAGLPKFMNIPGEELIGVMSANEFLTRTNLMKAYKNDDTPIGNIKDVVVVGGGNVAMDAARCARRYGCNVKIVYRRSIEELPARLEEVLHAKEEGIEFVMLTYGYWL